MELSKSSTKQHRTEQKVECPAINQRKVFVKLGLSSRFQSQSRSRSQSKSLSVTWSAFSLLSALAYLTQARSIDRFRELLDRIEKAPLERSAGVKIESSTWHAAEDLSEDFFHFFHFFKSSFSALLAWLEHKFCSDLDNKLLSLGWRILLTTCKTQREVVIGKLEELRRHFCSFKSDKATWGEKARRQKAEQRR